jgi:LPXTG-motif cell wall-anchored protein
VSDSGRHRKATVAGLVAMAAGSLMCVMGLPGGAAATEAPLQTPSSTVVPDNPTCGELGDFEHEFKVENPTTGTYTDEDTGLVVTITVAQGNPDTVSFAANIAVSAVFVKAGDGGILYTFEPPSMVGTGLASPKDSISHISFCWNGDQTTTTTKPGETTTTKPDETTTTTKPGETTTTTVPGETTTTTQPGGTTTVPDESTTTTESGGSATTVTPPTTTPDGELPHTGSSTTTPLLAGGAGLLAVGTAIVVFARRLRHA